jgi:hypothetical protein
MIITIPLNKLTVSSNPIRPQMSQRLQQLVEYVKSNPSTTSAQVMLERIREQHRRNKGQ